MEIRNIEDLTKFHEEFAKTTQDCAKAISESLFPAKILKEEKERHLKDIKAKMEILLADKEDTLRRYDEEIDRCKTMISHLGRAIRERGKELGKPAVRLRRAKKVKREGRNDVRR